MGLDFKNLDADTRKFMLEEIDLDVGNGSIYLSPWLTDVGNRDYAGLLRSAAENGSDDTLAGELRRNGRIKIRAERKKPRSTEMVTYTVPDTAPDTMAGEFNLFYIRALCRRAEAAGITHLIIYRARDSDEPRPESEAMIDKQIDVKATLADLRATHGTRPNLGFPPGPNSGLSARLP